MVYKDIINNIKSNDLQKIYLFYGREFYLIDNAIKVLKSTLNPSMIDFNLEIIDGKETNLSQITNCIETLPFMDERKIVIVKDFELLQGKKKNFTDSDEEIFLKHLENISQTTTLVFLAYGEIDKRKSLVKKINKIGIVHNCDKLADMELFKWIKREFNKNEVDIDNQEIMYFIEQEGYRDKNSEKTLSDLLNEIKKIVAFTGKSNKVTKEIIDKLSSKKVENDIFKLIEYIGERKASSAMKILNDMLSEGESVLGIFAMISRQFRLIMQVRQLQNQGHTQKSISQRLNIQGFIVSKALRQASNFSDEIIIEILNYILESDYNIKRGLIREKLSMEILISQYCDKIK